MAAARLGAAALNQGVEPVDESVWQSNRDLP
jgi:hypothetical protein